MARVAGAKHGRWTQVMTQNPGLGELMAPTCGASPIVTAIDADVVPGNGNGTVDRMKGSGLSFACNSGERTGVLPKG